MTTKYRFAVLAILLVGITGVLVLPCMAEAVTAGLGATPSSLVYTDVLAGGSSQKQVQVYNFGGEESRIIVTQTGQVADWLKPSPSDGLPIPAASVRTLTIDVQPPAGTAPGTYTGEIQLVAKPPGQTVSGGAGAEIAAGTVLPVSVSVTGTTSKGVMLDSIAVENTTWGDPLLLQVKVTNTGNVAVAPSVNICIHEPSEQDLRIIKTMVKTVDQELPELPPYTTTTVPVTLSYDDMKAGVRYAADVTLNLDGSEMGDEITQFTISEAGTTPSLGMIHAIQTEPYATVGEDVEVLALFENAGTVPMTTFFSGTVSLDGQKVANITSASAKILPGTNGSIKAYFVPEEPGKYTIAGHVDYKLPGDDTGHGTDTDEVEAFLEVFPTSLSQAGGWRAQDFGLMGAAIFLFAAVLSLGGYIWYSKTHGKAGAQ